MGRVEFGLEEEGIVAFGGVHRDVNGVDIRVFEVLDDFGLLFGVETEVGVDGEDEEFMTGGIAAGKKIFGRIGIALEDCIIARPHIDDAQVGVGIESLGELFPLMKHVALERVTDLIPREHFFFVDEVAACATLKGIEMDKSFVRYHARKGQTDAWVFGVVIVSAVKVFVVLDGEDLLEENEAIEDGRSEATGDGDDPVNFIGVAGCK